MTSNKELTKFGTYFIAYFSCCSEMFLEALGKTTKILSWDWWSVVRHLNREYLEKKCLQRGNETDCN
jgi:hypothetical protein